MVLKQFEDAVIPDKKISKFIQDKRNTSYVLFESRLVIKISLSDAVTIVQYKCWYDFKVEY